MILNYFKLALRVLANKKFFTFISLFGISITLMVLTLFSSFVESQTGNNPPMSDKDRMVFVDLILLQDIHQDTITTIDTLYENNVALLDTTYTFSEESHSSSSSSLSYHFVNTYMRNLDNVAKYTFFNIDNSFDVFVNNTKVTLDGIYADAAYFDVFDFVFTEGNAWDENAVDNQEQVVVITEKAALKYFGTAKDIIGREILVESKHYKISGTIKTPPAVLNYLYTDIYIPYTHMDANSFKKTTYMGSFNACFLGHTPADIPLIKQQIAHKASDLPPSDENIDFNSSKAVGKTFSEDFAQSIIQENDAAKAKKTLVIILVFLLSLFVLLPILNLIKINVSRIMDRSIEIGVRKAFGANKNDIMLQFIFENIILTLLGGAIGFILTLIVIWIFNETKAIDPIVLSANYTVLIYSILVAVLFGILSGLIPAMKMAKIHIVNALNENKL